MKDSNKDLNYYYYMKLWDPKNIPVKFYENRYKIQGARSN